jgi:hypothetical protein
MIAMFTATARSLRNTLESIATPCSVKAMGNESARRCFCDVVTICDHIIGRFLEAVTICDPILSNSFLAANEEDELRNVFRFEDDCPAQRWKKLSDFFPALSGKEQGEQMRNGKARLSALALE